MVEEIIKKKITPSLLLLGVCAINTPGGEALAQTTIAEAPENDGMELTLENEYLKVKVNPQVGAAVTEFLYKPTGRQESVVGQQLGGLAEDRLGGQPYPGDVAREAYQYRVVENTPQRVSATFTYTPGKGTNQGLVFTKTYTLTAGASSLQVDWAIKNTGAQTRDVVPWVHNIPARYGEKFGDMATLTRQGVQRGQLIEVFLHPATNWFARIAPEYASQNNLVYFVVNHNDIFQFYNTYFNLWHCMELIYDVAVLAPAQEWKTRYFIAASPALERVDFATVELAGGATRQGDRLNVTLSPVADLGEVTVKAKLLHANGETALEDKTITLQPGKSVPLAYRMPTGTAEHSGLRLTLYKDGKPVELGRDVAAHENDVVIPLVGQAATGAALPVIGRPETSEAVIREWPRTANGPAWKKIEPRNLSYPVMQHSRNGMVWAAPLLKRIFKQDKNRASEPPANRLNLSAARGERESFQLVLSPTTTGWKRVNVEIEPLKNKDGVELNGVEWRRVGYIETKIPPQYKSEIPIGEWPDPLLEPEPFDAPSDINTPLLFTVRVPTGAAAGEYSGRIRITANGGQVLADTPLHLKVWDFSLPSTPSFMSVIGTGPLFGNARQVLQEVGATLPQQEVARQLVASALEHRINAAMPNVSDVNHFVREVERYKAKGMKGIRVPANLLKTPDKLRRISDALTARGWLDEAFVYSPFDEAPPDRLGEIIEWNRRWKAITPIKIMQVYYYPDPESIYGTVDIWSRAVAGEPWIEQRQKAGDRFWIVNSAILSLERDLSNGRKELWEAFARGYSGQLLWTVAQWAVNPWDNPWYAASNGNGTFYYPYRNGFLESLRLETYTDALEDYEYLALLRIKTEELAKRQPHSPLVTRARAIYADPQLTAQINDINDLLQLREQIAALIVRIAREK